MNESTKALRIEYKTSSGESKEMSFFPAVDNISRNFIDNDFKSAALPVLGMASITSVYYEEVTIISVT